MKVDIAKDKETRRAGNPRQRRLAWTQSAPFWVNPRGVLAHRVKHVTSYTFDGEHTHTHADYWCNNGANRGGPSHDTDGRLLCVACEANAIAAGQPSAEELCGRHVCIGKLRAQRLCCRDDDN